MGAPQKSFGNWLMMQRKKKKFTQKDLAIKLSVSEKTVSRWENDESSPPYETVKKIEHILASCFTNSNPPSGHEKVAESSDQKRAYIRLSWSVVSIIMGYIIMLILRFLPYHDSIVIEALFGFMFTIGMILTLIGIGLIIISMITENRNFIIKLKSIPYWITILVFMTLTCITIFV